MLGPKKGLGSKGLGMEALLSSQLSGLTVQTATHEFIDEIDLNKIFRNETQPRTSFDSVSLEELALSIKEYGIIQPIIVCTKEDGYEIIAGERRFRAAKIAGLSKIPAIIKSSNENSTRNYEIALIENIQRENLNPIEEAIAYKKLNEESGMSQEEIATKVGKSRSVVANFLRLLNLDERVQKFVVDGRISNGHARTLLSIEDNDIQFDMAELVIEDQLSVRETEALVKKYLDSLTNEDDSNASNDEVEEANQPTKFNYIENKLKELLGTKVKLSSNKNKGKIEIEFYSEDDLDRILSFINSQSD